MTWGRNVFLKYGLGAKRLSKIWFGCETSSWTMKTGVKRLSYWWGGGETSFLSMSWRRNVSLKNGANWLWGEKSVYHTWRSQLLITAAMHLLFISGFSAIKWGGRGDKFRPTDFRNSSCWCPNVEQLLLACWDNTPNKHETLIQCWADGGPTLPTIGSMSRVC